MLSNISDRPFPVDPTSRADVEHVLEHGYVILTNVFSKQEAEEAKLEMSRLQSARPKIGRNAFEGFDTNRIYSILNKTRVFDKYTTIPRVLALNDYFLDPGYNISAFHTIQINPGENRQALHHGCAIMIAFDDFTPDNGATRIIPGSHTWGSGRQGKQEETIPAACPAGSVVYFIGTTWHGGGANTSTQPRMSATVQYCQPYIRPIENQFLAVDPRRLPEIPGKIVEMMGYKTHNPFIGYADGLNPVRASKRLVRWLQQPLDRNPPSFPSEPVSKL
ncbi:hypothetical protein FE257_004630 [Aspergillus nanangensis]|uniref:Phytanoyl-CoA dioxygenase n=1 Tax=Aspergillus nanangensis TaxID=2582783 RepID=A0AAD4CYD7_ASPNN|nr:hypothetical protein FE257_004630 [Aspergillus nanangensis]